MTRPDQTRPDRISALKTLKNFLKRIDRFNILLNIHIKIHSIKYSLSGWKKDTVKLNPKSSLNFDKLPYIIRRETPKLGLFSYFNTILGGIAYADQHGFIPVVDMKNYSNAYLYDGEIGKINAWEYYFEQPERISLEDALSCRKYIMGRDSIHHDWPGKDFKNWDFDYWRKICKKYIRFTPAVIERLEAMKTKVIGKKILGLLVRGTDYVARKPSGHPIPPTAEQAIAKAQEVMHEKNFDAVYLATEDKLILAKFQKAFGERLLTAESDYIDYDYVGKKYLAECDSNRKNDKYLRGLEYLVSMLFLSECSGFIASITSGSVGVMCLSEGFDYLYVFDLGLYP